MSASRLSGSTVARPGRRAARSRLRRPVLVLLRVGGTAAIMAVLVAVWGTAPFTATARALTWPVALGALALGAIGVLIQAQRWRLVARGQGLELGLRAAVGRCWQAAFINAVLPGGIAGDAVRAAEQDSRDVVSPTGASRGDTLKSSAGAVTGERLAGTVAVFTAAGIALSAWQAGAAALCFAAAVVAAAAGWPWLRRLSGLHLAAVAALSATGWATFAALFAWVCLVLAPGLPAGQVPALAAIALAGMSVPLNVAGWGPREGSAALGFALLGHSAEQGVSVSVAYGLLALVSVLPGGLVLLVRALRSGRRRTPVPVKTRDSGEHRAAARGRSSRAQRHV